MAFTIVTSVCVSQEVTLDSVVTQGPQHMALGLERSLRPRAFSASPARWATSCGAQLSGRACSMGPGQACSLCARVSTRQPKVSLHS